LHRAAAKRKSRFNPPYSTSHAPCRASRWIYAIRRPKCSVKPTGRGKRAGTKTGNRRKASAPRMAGLMKWCYCTSAAIRVRSEIQSGACVYKGGTLCRSETGASQFLATESPLNPGYAGRYGVPPENATFDFILTGRVRLGAPVVTRPSPGIPPNHGGVSEGGWPARVISSWTHFTCHENSHAQIS
jgi:hypothetical protein